MQARTLGESALSDLPELPLQYADYAAWQRQWLTGAVLDGELRFWRERLAGVPLLELPGDRPRPAVQRPRGARRPVALGEALSGGVRALARRSGATPFMVLLGGFAALLSRWSGQTDLAVGTAIAGRTRLEMEPLIGLFVNTLVMRLELAEETDEGGSFAALLRQVREVVLSAHEHQELPFERLVEELAPERSLSHAPLVQAMLVLQNAPLPALDLPGVTVELAVPEMRATKLDLLLSLADGPRGLAGSLEHSVDLFDGTTMERLLGHLKTLLAAALENPELPLASLPLLSPAERQQSAVEWNATARPLPALPVHRLFADEARRRPHAMAVVWEGGGLSYGELARRAARAAARLSALGVTDESLVGVCAERSPELVVALLAVLWAGGAFLPLEADYPAQRLDLMLRDSGAALVLAGKGMAGRLPAAVCRVMDLDALLGDDAAGAAEPSEPDASPPAEISPAGLAYVMYTSGSTGEPQGVAVPHRAVVRLVRETDYARFGADRVWLQLAPVSFDASTLEIWGALATGGTLALMPAGQLSLERIGEALAMHGVTSLWLTAGLFRLFVDERLDDLAGVRELLAGGDVLPPAQVRKVLALPGGPRVINGYGPTENTTFTCCFGMSSAADLRGESVPIGRPVGGTQIWVVDRRLRPVPAGAVGELLAGGEGLARGYLGRPRLTAERFVPDGLSGEEGHRLYRTGDMVRQLAGGELEFVGRLDHQVKVRGFRIELSEVESALAALAGVRESAVVAAREGEGGPRLVAFVAVEDGVEPASLRAALGERLPPYMVPQGWELSPALPLSPNGKVDRRELERRAAARDWGGAGERYLAPRTPVEELVAGVWEEVLEIARVGVEDDFFALGGHSLLATQAVSRLRRALGVEVGLRDLFIAPTPAAMALLLARSEAAVDLPLGPAPGGGARPLSFAQERLWFLDQLEPGGGAYNLPAALRLTGDLEPAALAAGCCAIVRRHEALRTVFAAVDGRPVQCVAPAGEVPLPRVDLRGLASARRRAEEERLLAELARRPFDLARGPLARLLLVQLQADEHLFAICLHHIVADGWSVGVFVRELSALYAAHRAGAAAALPALPVQYGDFASWQRRRAVGTALGEPLAYFRDRLAGVAGLDLPFDRPRRSAGRRPAASRSAALPQALCEELAALWAAEQATPFIGLLAGFAALLHRQSGQPDFALGTVVANRDRVELEELIGFFVNTLVLRPALGGEPTFRELLARTRGECLEAFARQEVPFEQVVEALLPDRDLASSPLFQVLFTLQSAPPPFRLPGVAVAPVDLHNGTAKFDLTLVFAAAGGRFAGTLEFDRDLFDATTAARLLRQLERLLAAAAARPDEPVGSLSLLAPAERHQLLVEWNDLASGEAADGCIHHLFAAQAARTPDAIALVARGEQLTYRELAARASHLAGRLRALGLGAEDRVAVCLERSALLVESLLGVLAAGCAYLGLDPAYPPERLAFLLADGRARAVVTQPSLRALLPSLLPGCAVVLAAAPPGPAEAAAPPGPATAAGPENLAYVIYTSGSTGTPKGVAIEHRTAVSMLRWSRQAYSDGELARVFAGTSICFDMSIFELFATLAWGGKVILAESALELPELVEAAEATLINTVPSAVAALVRGGGLPASLRTVNLGGEPLTARLVGEIARSGPARRVINLYGPSEDTTFSTWEVAAGGGEPTIGRSLAGRAGYVLDRRGELMPIGVPGDLHLGGAGVSRGYLGRPAMTAERFVPDPFAPGMRLYRTGDSVRRLADGRFEFLGRADHQVKVRGFRVELGEIEAAVASLPGVREAVVVARQEPGEAIRLLAYAAPEPGVELAAAGLACELARRLPAYMVPVVAVLDALPRNANGKVDRAALPLPSAVPEALSTPNVAFAASPLAELVVGIFSTVLEDGPMDVEESFFARGGHSLLATQVTSRLRALLGVDLPLRLLFEHPTAAGLAVELAALQAAGGESPSAPPLVRAAGEREAPLSFSQERLWVLDRLEPGNAAYNIPVVLALHGALRPAVLAASLAELERRHEVLRTSFKSAGGRPLQTVGPAGALRLYAVDLAGLAPLRREGEAARLAVAEAARPFDLGAGSPLRAGLLRQGGAEHRLLLTIHHIAADGWSLGVVMRECAALYGAIAAGAPSPLAELAFQYADYARWQRRLSAGESFARQLAYWRRTLAGLAGGLELPTDFARPPVRTFRAARARRDLPPALAAHLGEFARREGVTLFMLLLAGFEVLLQRHSGEDDIAVGTPIAGRVRAELEPLVGVFLNTLVLRADLGGNPSFAELLARLRTVTLDAHAHQDLPFERLLGELRPERDLARTPLFQVFFNMLNFPVPAMRLGDVACEPLAAPELPAKFDLEMYAAPVDGAIRLDLVYNADLYSPARIADLLRQLESLLVQAAADPRRRIGGFDLREDAAAALPDPRADLDAGWIGAVHELFAAQTRRAPDRLAVVDGEGSWSYGALDEQSNRLASLLAAAGIARGAVVAIHGHRSASLVWTVLGVLKSGAAFVILDTSYPAARLVEILEIARPAAWLRLRAAGAVPALLASWATARPGCLDLEIPPWPLAAREGWLSLAAVDPAVAVGPDDVACIGFTSGSTGKPKGILARHGPLSHFLPGQCERFGLRADDRCSMLSGLAHDPLQRDLFTPLYLGAAIDIPEPGPMSGAGWLAAWMERMGVSVAVSTPAMAQLLAEAPAGRQVPSLRLVFLVGDVLTRREVARLRRLAPRVTCVNLYGSTETQRAVAFHVVAAEGGGRAGEDREVLPLGRGMADVQLLVVNREGGLAAVGELGEIWVRSPHLALGYLDDEELSGRHFRVNPFTGADGDRVYLTGDLGRYRPDGEVTFAGRADAQVKIRGYRIELGEVEAHLGRLPGVREAVVAARDDGAAGKRLVAYVVAEAGADLTPAGLRRALRQRLPAYSVPAGFVLLPALPLTPNLKVDRRALLSIDDRGQAAVGAEVARAKPTTRAELAVCALLQEVLQLERVGVDDNFFDLGGNSLLLVQFHSRLQEAFARDVAAIEIFHHPTARDLARLLARRDDAPEAAVATPEQRLRLARGREQLRSRGRERRQVLKGSRRGDDE